MRLILPLLLALLSLTAKPAPVATIERQTPPPFGLGVGSVIHHRLELFAPLPWQLDTAQLPAPGPVNDWLEIRSLRLQTKKQSSGTRYLIDIDYQIFPSLKDTSLLEIPSLTLHFLSPASGQSQIQELPAWPFTVTPLLPANASKADISIRPLWQPRPLALSMHQQRLSAITVGLLLVFSLLAWQRRWLPWQRSPFSRALPRIHQAIRRRQPEQAFRTFHQALNETAGHAVFGETLPRFIQQHPQFHSLESGLRQFFDSSQALFFGQQSPPDALAQIESLCKSCLKAEKKCRK